MKRENDILMEKHALNKIRDTYYRKPTTAKEQEDEMPTVRLIATFKDEAHLYFVNEMFRSKNEVWEYCRSFGLLEDSLVRYVFYHICKQVSRLHKIGIIHRDLKPENMFFTPDMRTVKLIDLGSADDLNEPSIRETYDDDDRKRGQHKYFVGTTQYMGPECLHNKPTTRASDIWSLGCILYQLYAGFTPFRGASDYLIFQFSEEAKFIRLEELSEHVMPGAAKTLIRKMVEPQQDKRISIEEAMDDPFFDTVRELTDAPKLDTEHQLLRLHQRRD